MMAEAKSPKPRKRPAPTEAEIQLWRFATKDVAKLREETELPLPAPVIVTPTAPPPTPKPPALPKPRLKAPPPALSSGAMIDLDKATAERFRKGQLPIEAKLDLHGMTQEAAHHALNGFLESHRRRGSRCVLVITGKGSKLDDSGQRIGILREAVPRWLNEPGNRVHILAFSSAQARHGGGGALYVLLKRVR
jgi:DNA-nicking Smr family endonuclease